VAIHVDRSHPGEGPEPDLDDEAIA
jgi:hypothetical protein